MRSCRSALPFGDVPMHPTCADCSIGQPVSSCQLRTSQATRCCAAFTYFLSYHGQTLYFSLQWKNSPPSVRDAVWLTSNDERSTCSQRWQPIATTRDDTQDQTEWGPDIYSTAPCSRSSVTVLLWFAPPNSSAYPKGVHSTISPGRS